MNVGQLKKALEAYPDDMEVLVDVHSDYGTVSECKVITAVPQDSWAMRSHPTMSAENKAKEKQYLYIG